MASRLTERFKIGDRVEIFNAHFGVWMSGKVLGFDPPGMWVQSFKPSYRWYVTNGRRVRPVSLEDAADSNSDG